MNSNFKKVALNISKLSVPQKINKGRLFVDSIGNNPNVFSNPTPPLAILLLALDDLEAAWNQASDGGKSKTALMHDKERIVMKLLNDLAHYVESIADGDEQVIHLASMTVKAIGIKTPVDFELILPDDLGAVGLKCKARPKTLYRWEYCLNPMNTDTWSVATTTDVSSTWIGNLTSNVLYWFRVVLINKAGEHPLDPKCIVPL
ncbi:MAG: fibronectin type III domain-containing protein [Bacteroidetes bacterium]|nr:fibronectin type III domain-containing protein [Bacteroidota bacterium]